MTMGDLPAESFECPLRADAFRGCIPLSPRALQSLKTFAPITVAFHLRQWLDPQELATSLAAVFFRHPQYTGPLVTVNSKYNILAGEQPASVTDVAVSPGAVRDPEAWRAVMQRLPLRVNKMAGLRTFQALLLKSADRSMGCTLLVTLDHGLADATTMAMFVAAWSRLHVSLYGRRPLRPMPLPDSFDLPTTDPAVACRRFCFYTDQLAGLKKTVNDDAGDSVPHVTTNDLLVALVACAVAPRFQPPKETHALVVMMVDPRGRTVGPTYMGNAARSINLMLEWEALLSGDLAVVATAVRCAVLEGLAALATRHAEHGDGWGPPPPAGLPEPLFEWNSWARAEGLLDADFGAGLSAFDWVNLQLMHDPGAVVVTPAARGGGLALQVTLPHAQMAYLRQLWSTFVAEAPAA